MKLDKKDNMKLNETRSGRFCSKDCLVWTVKRYTFTCTVYGGLKWTVMGCTGLYCAVLGCTALYWAVLSCTGLKWTVLGCTGLY